MDIVEGVPVLAVTCLAPTQPIKFNPEKDMQVECAG